jgi:hypothetical protein
MWLYSQVKSRSYVPQEEMSMVNTGSVLDTALSRQHDTSSELRSKALGWLNVGMQQVATAKRWWFLRTTATLGVINNAVALPSYFDELLFLEGSDWYLKGNHHLSEEDAFLLSDDYENPYGFTISGDTLTLGPECADTTVVLTYLRTIPTYTDSQETLFPDEFAPMFSRGVINAVYEYESDQRAMVTMAFPAEILEQLKIRDNRKWPVPTRGKYL